MFRNSSAINNAAIFSIPSRENSMPRMAGRSDRHSRYGGKPAAHASSRRRVLALNLSMIDKAERMCR
jgi:hypothetical protein